MPAMVRVVTTGRAWPPSYVVWAAAAAPSWCGSPSWRVTLPHVRRLGRWGRGVRAWAWMFTPDQPRRSWACMIDIEVGKSATRSFQGWCELGAEPVSARARATSCSPERSRNVALAAAERAARAVGPAPCPGHALERGVAYVLSPILHTPATRFAWIVNGGVRVPDLDAE